jgi:hypothetical protein
MLAAENRHLLRDGASPITEIRNFLRATPETTQALDEVFLSIRGRQKYLRCAVGAVNLKPACLRMP